MKAIYASLIVVMTIVLTNCEPANTTYARDIIGEWKQDSWVIIANNRSINRQMDFTFTADERYEVDYGSEVERGKYWFVDDDLLTQEDGQSKKKVQIVHLTPDTLIFEMNRGGQIEQVTYIR